MKPLLLGLIVSVLPAVPGPAEVYEAQGEVFGPRMVKATITAYTSSPDETWGDPHETASGTRTRDGVAACPARFPFGTEIVIEGKKYVCEDRMNARYRDTDRFDIWVETKAEAYQWGKRELVIYLIIREDEKENNKEKGE